MRKPTTATFRTEVTANANPINDETIAVQAQLRLLGLLVKHVVASFQTTNGAECRKKMVETPPKRLN